MNRINIEQNNEITKSISDILVEYLYNLSKSLDNNVPQYMKGRLEVPHGYADAIAFLEGKFNDLRISSINGAYIRFKDYNVQSKLANNYGDGVGLTTQQAASINYISGNLFRGNTDITSFDELSYFTNLRTIYNDSFRNCTNLESIDLRNVDTIERLAFKDCAKLTTIKNYQHVTSYGYDVFGNCDLTGDYDFSNVDVSNNSSSNRILGFSNNKHITSIIMPQVQYLCSFQNCQSLQTLTGLESVIDISYDCFMNCYVLQNLYLPNVQTIGSRVFEHCDSMTLLDLPSLTTSDNSAFNNNANLIEINVPLLINIANGTFNSNPKLETVTVGPITEIKLNTFYNCPKLTTINMNFSLITSIGDQAFRGCSSLTSLSFPNVTILTGDNQFDGCSSLTSISLPKLEATTGTGQFGRCSSLTSISLPLLDIKNSSKNTYMFNECTSLTSVTLGEITVIPEKFLYNCKKLTSINIDWTKITYIGNYAFNNCELFATTDTCNFISLTESLTDAKLSGLRAPHLKYPSLIGPALTKGSNNFTQTVELNSNITTLSNSAFGNCKLLTTVTNLHNVTSIGNECFRYNSNMQTIDCSNKLKTIGNYAFDECINLTSISSDKIYPTSLGTDAFKNCLKLEFNIDLSQCTSIGGSAFYNCQKLTSIGSFSSELTSIGAWAFYNCGLTGNLDIPASVTTLGDGCFRYLQSLTSITFNSDVPPTTPTGTQFNNSTYIIYVPANVINDYKSSFPGEATSRIQAKP